MTARDASVYRCQQCGYASPKPGTCPDCLRAGAGYIQLVEERAAPARGAWRAPAAQGRPRPLRDITIEPHDRVRTGIGELDRVLGGGVVRGSLVLVGGDPGIGKCVTGDTRVFDPLSGDYRPVTAFKGQGHGVLSVDEQTLRLSPASVAVFHERGAHQIVEVRTVLGRTLRCTPDHPVFTVEGWRTIGSLKPGTRIASPRALPYFGRDSLPEPAIKLIAYILSDGSAGSQISVTSQLQQVERDLHEIANAFGMKLVCYPKPRNAARQYRLTNDVRQRAPARREFSSALRVIREKIGFAWQEWARRAAVDYGLLYAWRSGQCVPSGAELCRLADAAGVPLADLAPDARSRAEAKTPVARFLEEVGLRYKKARDKAIPECVFRLSRDQLALFLRILFTCDGSVYVNRRGQPGVSYSTISRRLAEDVQHLLLRFGFVATLRSKTTRVKSRLYTAYEVVLLGIANVQQFLGTIGIVGRDAACAQVAAMSAGRGPSTLRDTIPTGPSFWAHLRAVVANETFAEISRRSGVKIGNRRHERPLCRSTLAGLASAFPDARLHAFAHGDVYWDEIASVRPAGSAPVYDLTVAGSANFVANDLVIHNSTLLLQMARALAHVTPPVLYVSAEESAAQVKMRADRLGIAADGLLLWTETDLAAVQVQLDDVKPRALVVDSIQTVFLPELESAPGSVAQVRECGARLMMLAKGLGIATFLVGHVTKEGALAGPRVLEHLVDTVLYLEGESHHAYRVLRAVKNRFGSTNEIGVFQMGEGGLAEVTNPSEFFLAERPGDAPGSVIVSSLEGTRPLLLELQALVARASFGTPRRTVLGADYNRVCLLLAVLEKRVGMPLASQDVFVNVAGGGRVTEPAADLGIVLAAASSYLDRPVPGDVVVLGEVGLTGEVRAVTGLDIRLKEAAALGFRRCVVPKSGVGAGAKFPLEVRGVATVSGALEALLG